MRKTCDSLRNYRVECCDVEQKIEKHLVLMWTTKSELTLQTLRKRIIISIPQHCCIERNPPRYNSYIDNEPTQLHESIVFLTI